MKRLVLLCALLPTAAFAGEEPLALLERYDKLMGPASFEATTEMKAHREDDSERTYKMTMLKSGPEKFRAGFLEPSSAKGQEILRVGDNFWVYMPNLKRSLRMAARDSFMGGDFNNADVLRVNYAADYVPTIAEDTAEHWLIECKAKSHTVAYDKVKLWLHKGDYMPLKAQYFASSGAMIRSAEFKDVKDFGGLKRPSIISMRNELVPARWSEMKTVEMKLVESIPETKFTQGALGK